MDSYGNRNRNGPEWAGNRNRNGPEWAGKRNRNRNGPEGGAGTDRETEQERTGSRSGNGPEAGAGTGMGRKPEHETAEIQEKGSLQ